MPGDFSAILRQQRGAKRGCLSPVAPRLTAVPWHRHQCQGFAGVQFNPEAVAAVGSRGPPAGAHRRKLSLQREPFWQVTRRLSRYTPPLWPTQAQEELVIEDALLKEGHICVITLLKFYSVKHSLCKNYEYYSRWTKILLLLCIKLCKYINLGCLLYKRSVLQEYLFWIRDNLKITQI